MAIISRHTRLTHGYNTPFFDSLVDVASFLALQPTEEKPDPDQEAEGSIPSDSSSTQEWKPTPEAFDKLLDALSPDRDKAAEEYEILRRKLHRFLEWRGCDEGDRLTDIAFDRVMKKLDEGKSISNLTAYIYTVAKYVLMEWLKLRDQTSSFTETIVTVVEAAQLDVEEDDPRIRCFDECLAALSSEDREVVLEYYTAEKREKIERRIRLAAKLGISQNALRIRVHRIRRDLEICVKRYLGATVT